MVYLFNGFELDEARMQLRQDGVEIRLEPKSYQLLVMLVRNAERVVTKSELLDAIWPDVYVTEASLSANVKQVRKALGDDGSSQKFIKTVRGTGFRFVASIDRAENTPARVQRDAPTSHQNPGKKPTIAVLPFVLVGADAKEHVIADAVPIELISALSRLRSIKVIARASSFRFHSRSFTFEELQARLGADYVLSGAVEVTGSRFTIIAELADVARQEVIWSESYPAAMNDVFSVREAVVHGVTNAAEIRIPLNEADIHLGQDTEALDAWAHYHMGIRHLFRFNDPDNGAARFHFEKAIALDPYFARAYAGISYTEFENYNLWSDEDRATHLKQAITFAEKGVDCDQHDPFCNLVLGRAKWIDRNLDEAVTWVDRANYLNPNYAFGHYNSGKFKAINCSGEEADALVEKAMLLSPIDPHMQSMLSARAVAAFARGDGERETVLQFADQSLRAPNAHLFVCVLAAALCNAYGDTERTDKAMRQIKSIKSKFVREHFLSLFTLKHAERNALLVKSLDELAL